MKYLIMIYLKILKYDLRFIYLLKNHYHNFLNNKILKKMKIF